MGQTTLWNSTSNTGRGWRLRIAHIVDLVSPELAEAVLRRMMAISRELPVQETERWLGKFLS